MITKAIIPVAGWGTRRLPITKVVEKSMLPVGNRPLVDYSVQELVKAGVKDIYFITSVDEPCQVKAFYQDNIALNEYLIKRDKLDRLEMANTLPKNVNVHYVTQDTSAKYGTAVPIAMAIEKFEINEPVLVFMGDDFIWNPNGESATDSLIKSLSDTKDSAILGVEIPEDQVEKYGVLAIRDGFLTGIVEKPKASEAPSTLINVSKYIMSPNLLKKIVDYVHSHDFGPQDREYYVTDPICEYLAEGGVMHVVRTDGEYLDGGTLEGWLYANNVVCGRK